MMRARPLLWLPPVATLTLTPAWASSALEVQASRQTADQTVLSQAAPSLSVESVVRDLATIWAIDFAPDGRAFLTERSGRIRTVRDGVLDPEPWISIQVTEGGESGLMGLAI